MDIRVLTRLASIHAFFLTSLSFFQSLYLQLEADSRSGNRYATYDSPFEWYPLLRSHSRPVFVDDAKTECISPRASGHIQMLSLKRLKVATVANKLDPSKRICQYEVPGGGICRDEDCEDVHLSRVGI